MLQWGTASAVPFFCYLSILWMVLTGFLAGLEKLSPQRTRSTLSEYFQWSTASAEAQENQNLLHPQLECPPFAKNAQDGAPAPGKNPHVFPFWESGPLFCCNFLAFAFSILSN
jgi:hypothetical protein